MRGRPVRSHGVRLVDHLAPASGPTGCAATGSGSCRCLGSASCSSDSTTLMHAGDARGRLQVPDVRLDRADQQRPVRVAAGAERRARGLHLDRVAQRGAGAVRLQVVDVGRLRHRPGASASAITRCWATPLGTVNPPDAPSWLTALPRITARIRSPSRTRVLEPLDHDDPAALAAHVAVGGRVERLAPAVRRQHPRAGRR